MRDLPIENQEEWTEAGREKAAIFRGHTAVVIASTDHRIAAHFALGVAEVCAPYGRVIIADLCGVQQLEAKIDGDDLEGISDAFEFGLSFESIERPHRDLAKVSLIRVGTDPPLGESVFRSRRWKAMADRLLESDALLLLVTETDAPALPSLIAQLDGVVLVDADRIPEAPNVNVLSRVAGPVQGDMEERNGRFRFWGVTAAAVVFLAAMVLGYGFYAGYLELPGRAAARPAAVAAVPKPPVHPQPVPLNPADSARAALFAVEVLSANTQAGANFTLRRNLSFIPAATVASVPVGSDGAIWHKVIGGAFTTRSDADSLLALLRKSGIVPDSAGSVIVAPLALLLDTIPPQGGIVERIQTVVDSLGKRGFPVYALLQPDGSARLYGGAFTRPGDSETLSAEMTKAGLAPKLVYRMGRSR